LIKVYIAAPYTNGDVAINVRKAITAGEAVSQMGLIPYIPHLTHFWHLIHPHEAEFWYEYDLHWLECCDCLLRLPGKSVGADTETQRMINQGKKVFLDLRSLERWYKEKNIEST